MAIERRVDAFFLTASDTLIRGSIPWGLVERVFNMGVPIPLGEKISIKLGAGDRRLIPLKDVLIKIPMNMVSWQDN